MFVAIIDDTKPVKPSTAICQRPGTSWRFMPPSMNSHRMIAAAPIHTALVVSHTSFPPAANSFAIGSTVNWCIGSNLPASADTRVTPNYPWGHRAAGLNLTYSEPFLPRERSEEHTSELQSLMRISYAVFCLKKKINDNKHDAS